MLPSIAAAIIAGSPDAVLALDADGRYQDANPAACQLLGYSRDELLQLRSDDLIPAEATWLAEARAAYSTDGHWRGEIELRRKDGTLVPLEAYSVVIPSPDGPLSVLFLRDNTPQRAAQAALTHERDLLRTLMEHLPDAVYIKDTASRFLRLNLAAAHSLGIDDPTEALGKTDFDFYPEDRAREYFADEQQVICTGEPLLNRLEDRSEDVAAAGWWLTSTVPVRDATGAVVGLVGSGRDITERLQMEETLRQSEERFRTAFAHTAIGMALVGLDGHYFQVNAAFCTLTGYTEQELLATTFQDITHPDDLHAHVIQVEQLLAGEIGAIHLEKRYLRKDGGIVWGRLSSSLVRDEQGAPLHFIGQVEDVTDRKQAEEGLRQSEERFRTAFDAAAIGMALIALDGHFLQVNAALCALTGYTEAELLARTFQDITHPDDLATDLAQVDRLVAGEISSYQMEKRYIHKTGQVVWGHLSGAVVRDEHGVPLHFIGQVENITDRKQAEEELSRREAHFRSLITNATDLITILAADGTVLYESPAIERLLGYDSDELVGRNAFDLVHPDDRMEIWAAFEAALVDPAREPTVAFRFQHKDESWRWLESTSANLLADEDVGGFVVNSRDITDRRRVEADLRAAEAKYRTLVEQLPAVVYLVADDERHTPLFYNSHVETMTGETPEEAVARTGTWLERIHPEDRERFSAEGERARSVGGWFRAEYRYRRKDGSYVWVRDECVPLRDEAGQIIAWQGVVFDITERRQAEEELQTALGDAQAATRAKGAFLDMMSHELRTPLQAVLGYSELLLIAPRPSLTDEQRDDIDTIHQAGGRMTALINQALDLSRMGAGQLELATEAVDLVGVIDAVRQDVAPQARAKGLDLQIALPASLPSVIGDGEGVRQILLNLVGNAVKFTRAGHVRITAAVTSTGGVEVAVSDTGIGISAEALLHIFEAFHQVDSGLKRQHGGSGLGLAIAWKLAEQMGGTITVSSEPGVGSAFTLHLPGTLS